MTADRDRLLELLTDRALVGLGAREQIELAELLVKAQDVDVAAFDNAAAAVALASLGALEAMPAALAARIEQSANAPSATGAAPRSTSRPASDFAETRALDQLSPGYAQTQTDVAALSPAPLDVHETLVSVNHHKRTQAMPEPMPAPRSFAPPPPAAVASGAPHAAAHGSGPSQVPPVQARPAAPPAPHPQPSNVVPFRASAPSRAVAIGGWLAAAACLLLAIGAFAFRLRTAPVALPTLPPSATPSGERMAVATSPSGTSSAPSSVAGVTTPAALRDRLLASAGTTRATWSPTKDPAGKEATGEVVWNKEQQKGVMTFRGLARNDPARGQYQLWIFDKTRDEKYPVDGGVFDVDSETGDVLVAIHAALPVAAPSLFAVTLEKPGGVVVSRRERLVVTAKPAG